METDWVEEEEKFPDRLDKETDDCGGRLTRFPTAIIKREGLTAVAVIRCCCCCCWFFSGEGFMSRIR